MNAPTAVSKTPDERLAETSSFDAASIERPAPVLLKYYALVSLAAGPLFPVAFGPLLCKYLTLRYRFEADGVSMKWGVLFRREINLTYRRIQDIHLTNNIVQRWMGLANVAIQTASGSAGPEMTIEGVLEARPLRDYLYAEMRGAKGLDQPKSDGPSGSRMTGDDQESDRALALLEEIRDALRARVETATAETNAASPDAASPDTASADAVPPAADHEEPLT